MAKKSRRDRAADLFEELRKMSDAIDAKLSEVGRLYPELPISNWMVPMILQRQRLISRIKRLIEDHELVTLDPPGH